MKLIVAQTVVGNESVQKIGSQTRTYIACSKGETMEMTKDELRHVIKFLTLEHTLPVVIHHRLRHVYGASVVISLRAVERWP